MLQAASWHRTILLVTFCLLTFVLSEIVTTILEPIYPPSTPQEKYFVGALLLGGETIGAIFNLFLGFELWFWMLAFGSGWWANFANFVEVAVLVADFGVRMRFTGPPPLARCFHLIVCRLVMVIC